MSGRPSKYSDALAETICAALINGESLRQVCERDDMPDRTTVLRWMNGNDDFAAKYAHAREMQADLMDDLILETARACTAESAAADRVRLAAYQWRASKLLPKKYGDRQELNVSGSIDVRAFLLKLGEPED